MAKQGDFGGLPNDLFDTIIKFWGTANTTSTAPTAADRIQVLEALAKEEHAAARTTVEADVVAVALKVFILNNTHVSVIGGAPASDLVTAFANLEAEWK